jgi:DNA-binding NtrC family response regulator
MTYDPAHDTILIVEDEAFLRELATDLFEDAGYRVFSANNADGAARFLREHDKVNVLFTDVSMPGSMSGTDLAQYVAKRWPKIGIVIVSGRPLADKIPPGASFHYKPYETRSVLREVRELAARSRA